MDYDEIPDWYGEEEKENEHEKTRTLMLESTTDEEEEEEEEIKPKKKKTFTKIKTKIEKKPSKAEKEKKTSKAEKEKKTPKVENAPVTAFSHINKASIKEQLKTTFGHENFRGHVQEEAVEELTMGNQDCFVCLPTGGGKSLIYQLPAVLLPGLTLVISPLIALIQNQMHGLLQLGVRVESINSKLLPEERKLGCP